jgi:hypothetical protein
MSQSHRTAPVVVALLHLSVCVAAAVGAFGREGSWQWFPVFLVDFPFSIVLMPLVNRLPPLAVFGVFGTIWWFALVSFLLYVARRLRGPTNAR